MAKRAAVRPSMCCPTLP